MKIEQCCYKLINKLHILFSDTLLTLDNCLTVDTLLEVSYLWKVIAAFTNYIVFRIKRYWRHTITNYAFLSVSFILLESFIGIGVIVLINYTNAGGLASSRLN